MTESVDVKVDIFYKKNSPLSTLVFLEKLSKKKRKYIKG